MSFRVFQQGDLVKYSGEKFARELSSKVGTVCGRVAGTETGVVVEFGEDQAYIMSDGHLVRFNGRVKPDNPYSEDNRPKELEVTKRRGVGKGGKCRGDSE